LLGLSGPIPHATLGRLTELRVLSLSGTFPDELIALEFQLNAFSGVVPPGLSWLRRLQVLDLPFNAFNRTLPKELSSLAQLLALNLSNNSLSGRVPDLGRRRSNSSTSTAPSPARRPLPSSLLRFPDSAFAGNTVTRSAPISPALSPPSVTPTKRRPRLSEAVILAIVVSG
jgi:hypothetical protein